MKTVYLRATEDVRLQTNLTLWIPTYNRPREITSLLQRIQQLQIWKYAYVIVSNNSSTNWCPDDLPEDLRRGVIFENRACNISGGANFLRAFESVTSEWIHIMGDDDELDEGYLDTIRRHTKACDHSIAAIKFDTSLYGKQQTSVQGDLLSALSGMPRKDINDWFNNLLLISGWLFRREASCRYINQAYLGYGTKLSHLLPTLACCKHEKKYILFSSDHLVKFRETQDGWPKAASWVEMCLNTQLGHGYLSMENREALHICLFQASYKRLFAKILRIRQFYRVINRRTHWSKILMILSVLSLRFFVVFLAAAPFLLLPTGLWPNRLGLRLGEEGSTDRW